VWICVKDFLFFVQICLSRRGLVDLGQGGLPLLVVYGGRRMHYALLLVEVEGEWGGTRLATVDAAGGSTSQTSPSQIVDPPQYQHEQHYQEQAYEEQAYREQPKFQPSYQYQEGYEYHQGYQAQFDEGYQPEQPPQQQYVEPPQQKHPQQQQLEQHPQQHAEAGMEDEDGGFPGGLTTWLFYRTLVNTWHSSFGTIKQ